MSKRLQLLLEDAEFVDIQDTARRNCVTTAEWGCRVLREACRQESVADLERKLEVVRAVARHQFPTADVDRMLSEIGDGYRSGGSS
jgi:hypothetical protein